MLTSRQKEIEAHREIKKILSTQLTTSISNELKNVVNDKKTPKEWFEYRDNRVKKQVLKKVFLDLVKKIDDL